MNSLEREYRVLLAVYPPDYLEHREEELVTTLLAAARHGQKHPRVREAFDLLRSGLSVRAGTYGRVERSTAREWTVLVAAGAVAAIVTLAAGVPVAGHLTETPGLFAPTWLAIALLPVLFVAAPRLVRPLGGVSGAAALLGVIVGPSSMLAQRALLAAVAMFCVLIVVLRTDASRWRRALMVAAGIAVGACGAVRLRSTFSAHGSVEIERQIWEMNRVLDLPAAAQWVWLVYALIILAIITLGWRSRGVASLILGFVAIPTIFTTAVLTGATRGTVLGFPRLVGILAVGCTIAALAIVGGLLNTLRPRPTPTVLTV